MRADFSRALDRLRVVAALMVFASHLARPEFAGPAWGVSTHVGHSAVVIFFVLSGYVIGWVSLTRERDFRAYAIARAARLYSVVVPALLLTVLIDWSLPGTSQADQVPFYQYAHWPRYLALFLGFGTDAWFLAERAFSNPAYWSLTYEAAYYAAFGAAFFLRGWRRAAGLAVVLAIYGPRPLLLAPAWVAGAWLAAEHCRGERLFAPQVAGRIALVAAAAAVGLVVWQAGAVDDPFMAAVSGGEAPARVIWRYSRFAPGDLPLAALVALALAALHDRTPSIGPARFGSAIRAAADRSFTLYLLHFPLLEFWSAHLAPSPPVLIALVLGSAWIIGGVIEPRRSVLRRWLGRAWPAPVKRLETPVAPRR